MEIYDIRKNILLITSIENIMIVSLLDKLSYNICNSSEFWVQKFTNDDIYLINTHTILKLWIHEYKKSFLSKINSHKIMNILKTQEYIGGGIYFDIMINNNELRNMFNNKSDIK